MDDTATGIIEREAALADFDHARDEFEDAFSKAPDEALSYMPDGDDYSIGYLLIHVRDIMRNYAGVADKIKEAAFGEVRLGGEGEPPSTPEQVTDRNASLAEMEAAHDDLAGKLRALAYEDFTRKAPVYYPGSEEPYPTSAADIVTWVTDHYREHVPHVEQLIEGWKSGNMVSDA
jgi:hypothetical protein